uniref:Uncharacterized protein n=1 Tax=Piliocolobus tephrosceles TaxID=591936 RepID=A0A8C9LLG3_9PRIM
KKRAAKRDFLLFHSRRIRARGKFKEICEHPNGSCQDFCLKTEIHNTTPKKDRSLLFSACFVFFFFLSLSVSPFPSLPFFSQGFLLNPQ